MAHARQQDSLRGTRKILHHLRHNPLVTMESNELFDVRRTIAPEAGVDHTIETLPSTIHGVGAVSSREGVAALPNTQLATPARLCREGAVAA
jgi:hypothetical protein